MKPLFQKKKRHGETNKFLLGPSVPIQLIHKDQEFSTRVCISLIYQGDIALVSSVEDINTLPQEFFIRGGIDWGTYFNNLVEYWLSGFPVPYPFKFKKKLNPVIFENFRKMNLKDKWSFINSLQYKGYLPPLIPLKQNYQPKHLQWEEVASLCLKCKA